MPSVLAALTLTQGMAEPRCSCRCRATRHWSFPSERLEEFDQREFVGIAQARLLGKLIGAKIMTAVDDVVWTDAKPIEFPSQRLEDARRGRVINVGRHRR